MRTVTLQDDPFLLWPERWLLLMQFGRIHNEGRAADFAGAILQPWQDAHHPVTK